MNAAARAAPDPELPPAPHEAWSAALVMEDDESIRVLIQRILLRLGIQVDTAPNGRAGLDRLYADPRRYGVIVLDMMMPILDGHGVLAELGEYEQGELIKSVIVATATAIGQRDEFGEVFDAFRKPFDVEALANRIVACIRATQERRRAFPAAVGPVDEESGEAAAGPTLAPAQEE
jgi:DNA-binding response OmpR family regulator